MTDRELPIEPSASTWNVTISKLLERAAYTINDESTVLEICARTGLNHDEVSNVLLGNRQATVEGLYRIAAMLNVPAADLMNPSNTVIQCYSIDGGRCRTISLTPEDTKLIGLLSDLPLLYAEGLDGSYALLSKSTFVVFVNKYEVPVSDQLYLCESDSGRYVRRCVFTEASKHQAFMTDDIGTPVSLSAMKYGKLGTVGPNTEVILGRVIFSITPYQMGS
jgi:transcriptional regulator with XRE-family HTH domain